jgi:L-alanine-DL-glutamate epimerase-like enolase superfamily enzyme
VGDIPVPIAADESAHSDVHALERIELGYKIIALKPIAKTMSMTLKIAELAHEKGVQCFCADLTVNPVMVEWNKTVAARLPALRGMKTGILESNGAQNYRNWEAMLSYHPEGAKSWAHEHSGVFRLDEDFFWRSGGIFAEPKHYVDRAEV